MFMALYGPTAPSPNPKSAGQLNQQTSPNHLESILFQTPQTIHHNRIKLLGDPIKVMHPRGRTLGSDASLTTAKFCQVLPSYTLSGPRLLQATTIHAVHCLYGLTD